MPDHYSYKYDEVLDGYVFNTSSGVKYFFHFIDLTELFRKLNPDLESIVLEISFFPLSIGKKVNDPKIAKTITLAIKRIIRKNPNAIVSFVCDSSDNKHEVRSRLFKKWFNDFSKSNLVKIDKSMSFNKREVHRSILFSKKNIDGVRNVELTFFHYGLLLSEQ